MPEFCQSASEVLEMDSCRHCSKELSLRTALLTQDFTAEPLVFCSIDCQESWIDKELASESVRGRV
jgi:hypothetical protein